MIWQKHRKYVLEDEHAARVEMHRKYVLEGNEPFSCFDGSSHSSGYTISHHLSQDVCTNEGINLSKHILDLFEESLKSALGEQYEAGNRPSIAPITGDFQCYHPLGVLSDLQGKGNEVHADAVGQAISESLTNSQIVQSFCVEGLGVSFRLSDTWMEKSITNLVHGGIKQWAPKLLIKKALVDFSSPESSGAMDFLHFRAAIRGDSIARILEFSGVKVMRASHVTAYGSQGWQRIRSSEWKPMPVDTCQQLREFYTLAGIQWQDEEGTFYSVREEALKNLRNDMKEKFLVMPRGDILTELISLEYRLKYQKADWIIYISHATHEDHFFQTFKVAESAGWHGGDNDYPKFSHISLQKKCDFGLAMQFNDVFKGVKSRSENLLKFVLPESEYQRVKTSHSVAYASLKYAILKKTFGEIAFDEIDVKHLFNRKGKTAVYLLRTYSWISGMLDDDVHREELKKNNAVVGARALALYLLRFPEVIQMALDSLSAAVLCDYVYDLAMIFTQKFYAEYARDLQFARVHFDHQEQRLKELTAAAMSRRTLLIEATRIVMEKCLELLGLEPVSCLLF